MKHKTLKQKISLALYGAASFFMVLFTIGLILKTGILSRYPDGNEVYEIGRDALTLTAYFLAPVVALILFSDWRVEYKLKDDLIKIEEVNRLIIQIQKDIEIYYSKIFTLKPDTNLKFNNLDDRQNILILIGNLSYLCKRVYLIGVVAQDFNESVSLLIKETNEALNQIHTMEFFNYELNKQELYDREYYEEIFDSAREISSLYMKNKQERYDQFFELFKKLRDSLLENT